MSDLAIGLIVLAFCFVLIFLKMPVAIAFGLAGFGGLLIIRGWEGALYAVGTTPFKSLTMYFWTTIPMFVLMGFLAMYTGLAEEFYSGVRRWIGHLRGGLATAVIVGNTAFGACTGTGIAAAVTFTSLSLPEMRKYKYSDKLTLGSIAAGSLLAGIIPPSVGFILYGALTETSIGRIFIAGIIPGIILCVLYIFVILVWCWRNPEIGPPGPRFTWKERLKGGTGMWAIIVVFLVVIGGIYLGLFTPTEAGAFGAFAVLIMGLARKKLPWSNFTTAAIGTGVTVGMIGLLFPSLLILNTFLAVSGVPQFIADVITSITQSPTLTLWLIVVILLISGMFVDSLALLLLMTPIFFPVVVNLGIDPIHFCLILSPVLASGTLTPPFGIVIFAIAGIAKDVPLYDIFRGAAPFLIALMTLEALIIYFPQIVMFLPNMMMLTR